MSKETIKQNVILIAYSQPVNGGSPEEIVGAAAKLCYSKVGASELLEKSTLEKNAEFIKRLSEYGHESPFEHVSFTFAIEGISRTCSHQLVRHRIASYSQQSQRYVDLSSTFDFITPPEIAGDEKLLEKYTEIIMSEFEEYKNFTESLYNNYLKNNPNATKEEQNKFKKMALEDARSILPNACETKLVVTMNVRSLINFFKHRCCSNAQWEIRQMANSMLDQVLKVAPNLFAYAGAGCAFGRCPEGSKSCGKRQEPRPLQKKRV